MARVCVCVRGRVPRLFYGVLVGLLVCCALLQAIDTDHDGLIDYIEWSNSVRLSQINSLVRSCTEDAKLWHALQYQQHRHKLSAQ